MAIETPVAEILTAYLNTIRPDPDRWCFVYELVEVDGEVGEREDKTVNILVGEIKPPFKLKAPTLANVLSTMRHNTFFQDAIKQSPPPEGNDAAEEPTKHVPGHVLVAHALCQAYHYMIGSGCQYRYIASGESLVFLRVEDDRSLFYHFISFQVPAVRNAEGRRQQNRSLRQPHETAAAYLASLCVWAVRATPRSFTWIDAATETALRWPDSKKNGQKDSAGVLGIHRPGGPRPDDDDDAGGGEDSTGNSRPPTIPNIAMPSRLRKRGRSPEKRRQGEQSQRAQRDKDDAAEEAAALPLAPKTRPLGPFPVEPPTLPYCTQACLRGLVRGQALDNSCPNVALHRDARLRAESRVLQSGIYSDDLDLHPLTASALRARMVVQLAVNMDKDCQCLAPHTGKARYAKLFKLAVTGYGYTFVGKGVRAVSRKVLEHEAVVYNAVPQL
ncbi:fad dependent oxidoreductase superfamily [Ophiostoma piceae UAMH 11346]|uniref:Fad dependent oxidoreductase superfamily n=1 Tax=Ophiostoma piceae (strain UAMH 11346) TaxID=1262450 RepID=S3BN07_OPHP1|nr:fad dependent oxidoreductase superfamily [Ophiostoma piceae UAMH 11346]